MEYLQVGQELYKDCGGLFNDEQVSLRIEAVGYDWIVVRDSSGAVQFAHTPYKNIHEELEEYTSLG